MRHNGKIQWFTCRLHEWYSVAAYSCDCLLFASSLLKCLIVWFTWRQLRWTWSWFSLIFLRGLCDDTWRSFGFGIVTSKTNLRFLSTILWSKRFSLIVVSWIKPSFNWTWKSISSSTFWSMTSQISRSVLKAIRIRRYSSNKILIKAFQTKIIRLTISLTSKNFRNLLSENKISVFNLEHSFDR